MVRETLTFERVLARLRVLAGIGTLEETLVDAGYVAGAGKVLQVGLCYLLTRVPATSPASPLAARKYPAVATTSSYHASALPPHPSQDTATAARKHPATTTTPRTMKTPAPAPLFAAHKRHATSPLKATSLASTHQVPHTCPIIWYAMIP